MASSNIRIPNIFVTGDTGEGNGKKKKLTFKRRNTLKDFNDWFHPNGELAESRAQHSLSVRRRHSHDAGSRPSTPEPTLADFETLLTNPGLDPVTDNIFSYLSVKDVLSFEQVSVWSRNSVVRNIVYRKKVVQFLASLPPTIRTEYEHLCTDLKWGYILAKDRTDSCCRPPPDPATGRRSLCLDRSLLTRFRSNKTPTTPKVKRDHLTVDNSLSKNVLRHLMTGPVITSFHKKYFPVEWIVELKKPAIVKEKPPKIQFKVDSVRLSGGFIVCAVVWLNHPVKNTQANLRIWCESPHREIRVWRVSDFKVKDESPDPFATIDLSSLMAPREVCQFSMALESSHLVAVGRWLVPLGYEDYTKEFVERQENVTEFYVIHWDLNKPMEEGKWKCSRLAIRDSGAGVVKCLKFTGPTDLRIVLNGIGGDYGEVGARILEVKVLEDTSVLRVEQDYYLQAENFSSWKKAGVGNDLDLTVNFFSICVFDKRFLAFSTDYEVPTLEAHSEPCREIVVVYLDAGDSYQVGSYCLARGLWDLALAEVGEYTYILAINCTRRLVFVQLQWVEPCDRRRVTCQSGLTKLREWTLNVWDMKQAYNYNYKLYPPFIVAATSFWGCHFTISLRLEVIGNILYVSEYCEVTERINVFWLVLTIPLDKMIETFELIQHQMEANSPSTEEAGWFTCMLHNFFYSIPPSIKKTAERFHKFMMEWEFTHRLFTEETNFMVFDDHHNYPPLVQGFNRYMACACTHDKMAVYKYLAQDDCAGGEGPYP